MGKKINPDKRFVKDGPSMGIGGIISLLFAIALVGGIIYYVMKNHSDVLSLPSQSEIAKIHSDQKKL